MTDSNSSNGLEEWEMSLEQKREAELERSHTELEKRWAEEAKAHAHDKHLYTTGDIFGLPYPIEALATLVCQGSLHNDDRDPPSDFPLFFHIAVRLTSDEKAYELVRVHTDGRIVEHYAGRYESLTDAKYAAVSLSQNWDDTLTEFIASWTKDEREVTRSLKLNPWGRAVWERKHPEGPVLVVWQLEPLSLFVAGWLPFAGSRCIPTPVLFGSESDPSRINAMVDSLAEDAYSAGPSDKMIARAKSIAASYAANGRKGGRPKKGKKVAKPKDGDEDE